MTLRNLFNGPDPQVLHLINGDDDTTTYFIRDLGRPE